MKRNDRTFQGITRLANPAEFNLMANLVNSTMAKSPADVTGRKNPGRLDRLDCTDRLKRLRVASSLSRLGLATLAAVCLAVSLPISSRETARAQPAVIDRPEPGASRFIGRVTDLASDLPIAGARVGAGSAYAVTGEDGRYAINVPPGRYDMRVTAIGFQGATIVGQSTGVSFSREVRRMLPDVGDSVNVDVGLPPLIADDESIRSAARRLRGMAVSSSAVGEETMMHSRGPTAPTSSAAEPEPVPRDVRILMPDGNIVQVEMDEYLKGVVPVEMGYVFRRSFEALRAQAIASRTYATTSCLPASAGDPARCERGLDANVDTTTRTQAWGPVHYDITDSAVESTHGQVARLEGRIVQSLYFARTVGRTLDSESSPCCGGRTLSYLRSVWSPDAFDARRGHGSGMSQEGAAVLADWGATAEEIIEHYYRGTEVGAPETGAALPDAAESSGSEPRDEAETPTSPGDGASADSRVRAGEMEFGTDDLTPGPALGAHSVLPFDSPAIRWLEGPETEADFPFMALAARWSRAESDRTGVEDEIEGVAPEVAQVEENGDARLMVRVSDDGIEWSAWSALLPDEGDGRSPAEMAGGDRSAAADEAASSWTRLVIARGRFAQLRIALLADQEGATPAVERVTLYYLDADSGPVAPDAPVRASAEDAEFSSQSIEDRIILRSGWGADESLRFDSDGDQIWPPFYTAPRAQIVHHTVTTNDPADPAAIMRAVYHYHAVTRGWGDIGYNFLIDHRGNVYEGRFGGERDGRITQGGHALQFNSNSIGVALLGTFTASGAKASDAAEAALVDVLAAKGIRYGINPNAPVTLVSTRFTHSVMGHRDALPGHTACPGLGVHEQLDSIRSRVVARMAASGPGPTPTTPPSATPRPTRTLAPPSTAVPTTARTRVPTATTAPPTAGPGASATPGPACIEMAKDGGFEASDPIWQRNRAWFTGWDVLHGATSMFVGLRNTDPDSVTTYASVAQTIRLPEEVGSAALSYSARSSGQASDKRRVRIFDEAGGTVALSGATLPATSGWQEWRHDLGDSLVEHAGRRVRLYFGVINDGDARRSYIRLDDVSLRVCGGVSPASPTSAPASPTPNPTPTSAPTLISEPGPTSPTTAPTALPLGCTDTIVGGDFESGDFGPWRLEGDHTPAIVDEPGVARSGDVAARLGLLEADGFGYSAIAQRATSVGGANSASLALWMRAERMSEGDTVSIELRWPADGIRRSLFADTPPSGEWTEFSAPLLPEELVDGLEIYASVLNRDAAASDGEAGSSTLSVLIDDISLIECRPRTFRHIFPRLFGRPEDPLTRP